MVSVTYRKRRVSRKVKKWHKKNGWGKAEFTRSGKAYWVRDYAPPFMLKKNWYL